MKLTDMADFLWKFWSGNNLVLHGYPTACGRSKLVARFQWTTLLVTEQHASQERVNWHDEPEVRELLTAWR
jgi:hypothetical protein